MCRFTHTHTHTRPYTLFSVIAVNSNALHCIKMNGRLTMRGREREREGEDTRARVQTLSQSQLTNNEKTNRKTKIGELSVANRSKYAYRKVAVAVNWWQAAGGKCASDVSSVQSQLYSKYSEYYAVHCTLRTIAVKRLQHMHMHFSVFNWNILPAQIFNFTAMWICVATGHNGHWCGCHTFEMHIRQRCAY